LKRHVAGLGKFHPETTLAQVTPELLSKQHLDIRFIIDHEDEKIHRCAPICIEEKGRIAASFSLTDKVRPIA
jgi:hypothetical protein